MGKRENITVDQRELLHRLLHEGRVDEVFAYLKGKVVGHRPFGLLIRKDLQGAKYKNVIFDGETMHRLWREHGGIDGWRKRHTKSEQNKKVRAPNHVESVPMSGRATCPICRRYGSLSVRGCIVDGGKCCICLEENKKMAIFFDCSHAQTCVECAVKIRDYTSA